jgi:hypothetical protein
LREVNQVQAKSGDAGVRSILGSGQTKGPRTKTLNRFLPVDSRSSLRYSQPNFLS